MQGCGRPSGKEYRTQVNSPSGTIADQDEFTHDGAGRVLTAEKGRYNNLVEFTYDDGGRIESEALTIGMSTWTITHEYDDAGRRTETTYPSSNVVTRSYTPRDRLQSVSRGAQAVASFSYDDGNRETTRTHGNGLVTNRTYKTGENLVETITVVNRPTLSFEYGYDDNHNVTAESIGGVLSDYSFTAGYDDEDRLTSWERTNGDEQLWGLSDVGNWDTFTENTVQQTRTHGPAHELTAIGNDPLAYDPKGNLTEHTNSLAYVWDFDNHLKQVMVPVGSPVGVEGTHTYAYDALGRRVSKTVDGVTTVFVQMRQPVPPVGVAGGQTLAEYENSTLAREYVHGRYVDQPLVLVDRTDAGIVPAGTDELFWYHHNRIYNIAGLSDSSGALVEHVVYTPFGGLLRLAADGVTILADSPTRNAYAFTSRQIDRESQLFYFRARYFDQSVGRFLSRDPLRYIDGPHLYYAYFVPHAQDPSGLRPWSPPESGQHPNADLFPIPDIPTGRPSGPDGILDRCSFSAPPCVPDRLVVVNGRNCCEPFRSECKRQHAYRVDPDDQGDLADCDEGYITVDPVIPVLRVERIRWCLKCIIGRCPGLCTRHVTCENAGWRFPPIGPFAFRMIRVMKTRPPDCRCRDPNFDPIDGITAL